MDKKHREAWFSTTEVEELVGAIEHCAELALAAQYNLAKWKWLILALHSVMQGACACALRGSDANGTAMLTKQSAAALCQWRGVQRRRSTQPSMPPQNLASLAELYRRAADANRLGKQFALPVTVEMTISVAALAKLRREFGNFRPGGYSLEVSSLPKIVRTCCDAIQHLVLDQSTFQRQIGGNLRRRTELALKALRKAMDRWEIRNTR